MQKSLLALLLIAASSCASTPEGVRRVTEPQIAQPLRLEAYRLVPGDEVELKFFHTPELDLLLTVRPDGRISVPLGDGVQAAGRTPEELARDLEDLYAGELLEPEIAVIARTFSGWQVHVDGEVEAAGRFPLTHDMRLLDAIAEAGGWLPSGNRDEVLVIRHSSGERELLIADLDKALDGSEPWQNIALHPGDAVYVPRSGIANVNAWVDQYIRQNLPVDINYGIFR